MKRLGKTDYKYVYIVSYDGVKTYSTEIPTFKFYKCFPDIRDTAVDKKLMEKRKRPCKYFISDDGKEYASDKLLVCESIYANPKR